jgi:hypothetical protein
VATKASIPSDYRVRDIWDLGGGTGTLLRLVGDLLGKPWRQSICVEVNAAAVAIGRRVYGAGIEFRHANIVRFTEALGEATREDVLIIMPGRLLEMITCYASKVLDAVRRWPGLVVVYQYADTQSAMPGLLALARDWWPSRRVYDAQEGVLVVGPTEHRLVCAAAQPDTLSANSIRDQIQ